MPGATLPNLGIVLPSLGGDAGTWDDELNAAWGLVDAHDHTPGKGIAVPTAGININANLPMGGYGLTSLGQASFAALSTPSAGSKVLYVDSADNELYWITSAGTRVKLTSGTSINTTLVGGILGDYSAVGAVVAYDDANDRYTFKQQSPFNWARLASGDVRIYEYNTTETVYVGLKAPSALAAPWDITFPLAAPGSTSLVLMDSSGVLTATNTVPNATTFSTSISVPSITSVTNFTSAVTMASSLGVTGALTVTGYIAANVFVNMPSFSTAVTLNIAASLAEPTDVVGGQVFGGYKWDPATSTADIVYAIHLPAGSQLTSWKVYAHKTTNGTKTITARLLDVTSSTNANAAIGSTQTNTANAPGDISLGATGLTTTFAAGHVYYIAVTASGTSGDTWYDAEVTYTRP